MFKAQNILHTNDSEPGRPYPEAIASSQSRDEVLVGQPTMQDDAGPGPRSLLADPVTTKGRRSLFRR